MPELPEVETVIRSLEREISNLSIINVEVLYPKMIDNVAASLFCQRLKGECFISFGRRGKYILFYFRQYCLVVHLRMEGRFVLISDSQTVNKHVHVIFTLSDGRLLLYQDTRKFGRMYLYDINQPIECLNRLGWEFWDEQMNCEALHKKTLQYNGSLKQLLLDQHLILGVGNIYADEICFLMSKHPKTLANKLTLEDVEKLITIGKSVLEKAIAAGGTTIRSYVSLFDITGRFQQELYVHQRVNQPCRKCQTKIVKIKLASRGTYFCPCCQPMCYSMVGITGNMGSGKSTALSLFKSFGFNVIDCDEVVDCLLRKKAILMEIALILNIEFVDNHLENKKLIADVIFSDIDKKNTFERYIHPIVMSQVLQNKKEYNIIEVQRLFQSDLQKYFDATIAIISDQTITQKRLIAKGMAISEIKRRKMQSNPYFIQKATFILENYSDDRNEMVSQVYKLSNILKGDCNVN